MRDILFRAKCKDNGEWVEGNYGEYYVDTNINGEKKVSCISIPSKETISGSLCYEVVPETVGEYTGLKDKNGTKIFEGDVLKILFGKEFFKAVVKFGYYNQTDQILKTHLGFYFDFVDSESYRKDVGFWGGKTFSKIEVIGNVHDGGATAE